MVKSKRRNYTIKEKLDILSQHAKGVKGKGFFALGKKHQIAPGTIRGWWDLRDKLKEALRDRDITTRTTRRLGGGGRPAKHGDVEFRLHEWILDRNTRGLRVKDAYIRLQALNIYRELHGPQASGFDASTGWLARFKRRKNLVSRRQTTTRILPDNAGEICRDFIHRVHQLIDLHNIKLDNIVNMDQVPRYFETEPKTTITTRGSREVLLKKGGTSHKRFTATFAITASGIFLKPHLLFSKLKNRPKCPDGVLVDVNSTGMWNEDILLRFSKAVLCSRKETQFFREPVLYLIDSYACHVALAESTLLERYNIFVVVVPPNLTSILQPLDVAVNRSYQSFYRNKYDDYISRALVDPVMQTAAGNPKIPHYKTVAEWTLDWVATRQADDIKKAFTLCGIVPKSSFNQDKLHQPLRDLLEPDLDMEKWHASYQYRLDEADDREQLCVSAPSWYLPENERPSLFYCLLFGTSTAIDDFVYELVNYMKTLDDLDGLIDAQYLEDIQNGDTDPGELEIYAASKLHNWNVEVTTVDKDCKVVSTFTYEVENPMKTVHLARSGSYFAVEVDGCIV